VVALYVTHPQVLIDPAVPVPDWDLSPQGHARAEAVAEAPWVRRLGRVVTSAERKARETAAPLARAAGVEAEVWPELHENDRSATGYLPPAEFERTADAFFARPDESVRGWEAAGAAQARVVRAVAAALRGHPPSLPVAIVGHGAVGTLLWLALSGLPISRDADQPAGGGHLFAFPLPARPPLMGWTPMDAWDGLALVERNRND
jgi:broad specificity phosphatase PhoE